MSESERNLTAQRISEGELRRYLLGKCSAEESAEIERAAFQDNGVSEAFSVIEDELTEDYVCDQLNYLDTALFEQKFLTNKQRREKVRLQDRPEGSLESDREDSKKSADPDKSDKQKQISARVLVTYGGWVLRPDNACLPGCLQRTQRSRGVRRAVILFCSVSAVSNAPAIYFSSLCRFFLTARSEICHMLRQTEERHCRVLLTSGGA